MGSTAGGNAGNTRGAEPGASQAMEDVPARTGGVSFKGHVTCRGGQRQQPNSQGLCSYKPWVPPEAVSIWTVPESSG